MRVRSWWMSDARDHADMLTEREAAALLGIGVGTLRTWRFENRAPARYQYGRTIRYARSDVQRWQDDHRVT